MAKEYFLDITLFQHIERALSRIKFTSKEKYASRGSRP
jgi:hypothetical protein